nr:immunoglobulin heavy chain junction region [Mus musculus]
CARWIYYYDYW